MRSELRNGEFLARTCFVIFLLSSFAQGIPPATLAEWTLNAQDGLDYYDGKSPGYFGFRFGS